MLWPAVALKSGGKYLSNYKYLCSNRLINEQKPYKTFKEIEIEIMMCVKRIFKIYLKSTAENKWDGMFKGFKVYSLH